MNEAGAEDQMMAAYNEKGGRYKIHNDDVRWCNNCVSRNGGGTMKVAEEMTG